EGVTSAEFGLLKLGPVEKQTTFTVVLIGGDTHTPSIYVDANADGDLTNDPLPDWRAQPYKGKDGGDLNRHQGSTLLQLPLGDDRQPGKVSFYRFDAADTARTGAKGKLFYYRDYGLEGNVKIGQYPYKLYLSDDKTTCDFRGSPSGPVAGVKLYIDINGNSHFDKHTEGFDIRQPFKIGTKAYDIKEMSPSGRSFVIVPQDASKKESPSPAPPPTTPPAPAATSDLRVGSPAIAFKATGLDGKELNFPGDYNGKIVLLDFWATWCAPCRKEVPNLVETYKKHHKNGFEILSISLDKAGGKQRLTDYAKDNNMPWKHVFDGKHWSAEVAQLYRINSIPAAFLVDGDTGRILSTKESLHGPRLAAEVDGALKKKHKVK
ncbi:MAG: TlpA family protein disulfide reductase, partial [Pyrinomonadaceae bacterium]|nr:TlpA family protein disulfide reductase [Phycisphaerales bacterium]